MCTRAVVESRNWWQGDDPSHFPFCPFHAEKMAFLLRSNLLNFNYGV